MFKLRRETAPTSWAEVETELDAIRRYKDYDDMWYRSRVGFHTKRVVANVEALAQMAEDIYYLPTRGTFDGELAVAIAHVHDHPEIITDDISLLTKDLMSPEEKAELKRQELLAIGKLSQALPQTFMGFNYGKLLLHAYHKDCLEAQFVKWIDWIDAIGEIMHEILAGNFQFLWGLMRSSAGSADIRRDYPMLMPLKEHGKHPFLEIDFTKHCVSRICRKNYAHLGRPWTEENLLIKTDFAYYDSWKENIVKSFGVLGIAKLIEQQEGLDGPVQDESQPVLLPIAV